MKIAFYETSLSDDQWAFIEPMIPKPKKLRRPRTDPPRILDAVLLSSKAAFNGACYPATFLGGKRFITSFENELWITPGKRSMLACVPMCAPRLANALNRQAIADPYMFRSGSKHEERKSAFNSEPAR
jgi:hypothetical protein